MDAWVQVPGEVARDLGQGTRREWLETNGLGSFAMGTVGGPSTRRYHSLLTVAMRPPVGRMVLVNRTEELALVGGESLPLSANFYRLAVHPDGYKRIQSFALRPWPTWTFRAGSALIEKSIFMPYGRQMTVVLWRLIEGSSCRLLVKPLASGRDYHAMHHENTSARTDVDEAAGVVVFAPYAGVAPVFMHHNGSFAHRPEWFRRFQYYVEQERGLEPEEDLLSPGEFSFMLDAAHPTAELVFSTEGRTVPHVEGLLESETKRRRVETNFSDPHVAVLLRAADQFVVQRGAYRTLVAGYPWFTDWGRDTFISLPGIALATGKLDLARELILAFADHIRDGLVPNRFPDAGEAPEYNTVDAPLWFVVAVCRFARMSVERTWALQQLFPCVHQVIDAYLAGTRHGIGVDDDGLIHASAPGLQLTWMDAKVGDWVVTPRQGKPVEIQALWVAALEAVARWVADAQPTYAHELIERAAWARSSFQAIFWDEAGGHLCDVIDGPRRDTTLRPNQLYALGLCDPLVDAARAERVLAACERELLTPVGLRTRSRGPGYQPRITGDQRSRDAAYHQGTVWPYLLGIYADACQRVRGQLPAGLLDGVYAHLMNEGLGSIYEIFDGDPPHTPRGCIAQAWSVAETLRVALGYVAKDA